MLKAVILENAAKRAMWNRENLFWKPIDGEPFIIKLQQTCVGIALGRSINRPSSSGDQQYGFRSFSTSGLLWRNTSGSPYMFGDVLQIARCIHNGKQKASRTLAEHIPYLDKRERSLIIDQSKWIENARIVSGALHLVSSCLIHWHFPPTSRRLPKDARPKAS